MLLTKKRKISLRHKNVRCCIWCHTLRQRFRLEYVCPTPVDDCNGLTGGFVVKETNNIHESPFEETAAEVRRSTDRRATALGSRPTIDPPRRLGQPSTGVSQLTNLLDAFGDQVPGYHKHQLPQRLRLQGKSYIWLTVRSKSWFSLGVCLCLSCPIWPFHLS